MENFLFSEITYLLDFIKLFIICVVWIKVSIDYKRRFVISIVISIILMGILSLFIFTYDFSEIYGISALIILGISTIQKKKIKLCALYYIMLQIVEIIICTLVMLMFRLKPQDFVNNVWLYVPMNCIALILISIISIFVYKKEREEANIPKSYVVIIFIGGVLFATYISIIQLFGFQSRNWEYQVITISITMSSIIFVIITVLLVVNRNRNVKLEYEIMMNKRISEQKEEYFNMVLEKDNETRAFRHDVRNHLYSMEILLHNKKYNELEKYLKNLNRDFVKSTSKIKTGNDIINALVNHFSEKYKNVRLEWDGIFPASVKLPEKDMCTIFSNLLSNAFEAAEKTENKWIKVEIKSIGNNFYIQMKNATINTSDIKNGVIKSSKNEEGHGYGTYNIKKCMEDNNGKIEYKLENGIFKAEIILLDII